MMINHRSHSMRSSRKIRTYLLSVSLKTWGRPIAACVIYRCLLHWRSFEVERTTIFDRIIQTIGSAIEV
ncbi:unnamed protein product [Musa hybrid cultivar]